jgi:plastocyanin
MGTRIIGSIVGALGIMTAAVGVADVQPAPAPPRVDIRQFAFSPAALTVPVGSTVTWVNDDEEPHTVTSSAGAFASTGLEHEETFSRTFATAGTYRYFCALHPHMTGTVLVR